MTPLTSVTLGGHTFDLKLNFLCPTGSFKDRGTTVMMSKLREWGLTEIVEDSSGNAGASVAAYSAAAGIPARIFIPADTSAGKAAQIQMYGSRLERSQVLGKIPEPPPGTPPNQLSTQAIIGVHTSSLE